MRMIDERVPPCQDVIDRRKLKARNENKEEKSKRSSLNRSISTESPENLSSFSVFPSTVTVDTTGSIRSVITELVKAQKDF